MPRKSTVTQHDHRTADLPEVFRQPEEALPQFKCCGECRWWKAFPQPLADPEFGQCRRFPPQLILQGATRCPETRHDHWCGEWWQKPPQPESAKPDPEE